MGWRIFAFPCGEGSDIKVNLKPSMRKLHHAFEKCKYYAGTGEGEKSFQCNST